MAFPRTVFPAALRAAFVVAFVAIAAALGGFGSGGVAHAATNTLVSSDPADGARLDLSPTTITLTFAQPLGAKNTVLATCGPSASTRQPFSVGAATVRDGVKLMVDVPSPMPRGSCAIAWRTSTVAGDPDASGAFQFTVASEPAATTAVTTAASAAASTTTGVEADAAGADSDDAPRVGGPLGLGRVLATLGLAMVLGALVLIVTAWPEGVEYVLTVRFLRSAWVVALFGAVLTVVCLTAQTTGRSFGASISPTAWTDLMDTGPGRAAIVRLVATAGIGWVVLRPERALDQTTQLASIAIPAIAVATLGFSRTGGDAVVLGVIAGVAHALAMAIWLGGLVLLWRVVLAGPGEEDLVHAVRGFGRLATPALLTTVVTGAVQTYRLDSGSLFSTGHGAVLLFKAVVVGVMVFVGLATRQFVNHRLAHVDAMTAGMSGRLRRAVSVEVMGGVIVLALSAWLLALTPGNVDADDTSAGRYPYTQQFQPAADLDVTMSFDQVVGRNGVLVRVAEPATGLANLTVRFDPPAGSGASSVVLTVPLTGRGSAELASAEGLPIAVPGTWVVTVSGTTPAGTAAQQKNVTIVGGQSSATATP